MTRLSPRLNVVVTLSPGHDQNALEQEERELTHYASMAENAEPSDAPISPRSPLDSWLWKEWARTP